MARTFYAWDDDGDPVLVDLTGLNKMSRAGVGNLALPAIVAKLNELIDVHNLLLDRLGIAE